MSSELILHVKNLTVAAEHSGGLSSILHDVSFQIYQGETLALVGESGSGKTLTALSLLDLLPNGVRRVSGEISFKLSGQGRAGEFNGTRCDESALAGLRGKRIAMIFQEPHAALNPVFRVGVQIDDVIRTHLKWSASTARERTLQLLRDVRFPDPVDVYRAYPHQLSGGMAQRVMIAMALSCQPQLIVADEPTTSLDATIQLHTLQLINELQREHGFACLLISHDIGMVRAMADSLLVMKTGRIVERGETQNVLTYPQHPYTQHLVASVFELPSIADESCACPV